MQVVYTNGWTWEQMRPHWPAVMQALRRREREGGAAEDIARRAENLFSGRERLWLILDEGEAVFLVTLTVETTRETGRRKAVLQTLTATDQGASMGLARKMDAGRTALAEIERWAAERGIDEIEMTGRAGLKRLMEPQGYRQEAVVMRKMVGG